MNEKDLAELLAMVKYDHINAFGRELQNEKFNVLIVALCDQHHLFIQKTIANIPDTNLRNYLNIYHEERYQIIRNYYETRRIIIPN